MLIHLTPPIKVTDSQCVRATTRPRLGSGGGYDRGVLIHAWTERHASPASLLPITGLFNLINVQLAGRKTDCAPTPGQGGGERGAVENKQEV